MRKMKPKQRKLFELICDAMFDETLIIYDMKGRVIENPVDVCLNGPCIQITIRPVIAKTRKTKK